MRCVFTHGCLKGIVNLKMKILLSFIHLQVVSIQTYMNFFLLLNTKVDILKNVDPNICCTPLNSIDLFFSYYGYHWVHRSLPDSFLYNGPEL